jgi:hypothetical protein
MVKRRAYLEENSSVHIHIQEWKDFQVSVSKDHIALLLCYNALDNSDETYPVNTKKKYIFMFTKE